MLTFCKEGFKSVVHSKDAAKRIALNLDSVNSAMKLQVMRLLVGICLLDDSGADDGHKYAFHLPPISLFFEHFGHVCRIASRI